MGGTIFDFTTFFFFIVSPGLTWGTKKESNEQSTSCGGKREMVFCLFGKLLRLGERTGIVRDDQTKGNVQQQSSLRMEVVVCSNG